MTTVNIIHHTTVNLDQIQTILAQGKITINQISQGNPLEITDGDHPCIHLLSDSRGLSIQEENSLTQQLTHRFIGAETAITAQSIFSSILIGMSNQTLHIFIPNQKTILGNLSFVLSQFHPIQSEESTHDISQAQVKEEPQESGIHVSQTHISPPVPTSSPRGWQEVIKSLGGTLDTDSWTGITPELKKPAPVRNILEQAGKRAIVRFENKKEYTVYGYPNLSQSNAKVLLIGADGGNIEIIALHRSPQKVGIVSTHGCGWLPQKSLTELSKEITNRPPPKTDATVFAIDSRSLYYESAGTIFHWDGKKERNFGNPNQALSSLLLQWSQQ
ncbi:MAG: hypothetical protein CL916_13020 [Deltaproteobacteria bacterium]|nr:hypothetical protein [Deltaproteobacteria bacterium]